MTNGNRGPIGLPLRRAQSRNALMMSAIQEERASAMSAISVESKPLDSCASSPTTSSSSSDSSPHQQPLARVRLESVPTAHETAKTTMGSSERQQSLAKVDRVAPLSTTSSPSPAPHPNVPTQSARMLSAQRLADIPLAGAKGLKSAVAKQLQSISARSRSIPYFTETSTTNQAAASTTSSKQACSDFCRDDSLSTTITAPTNAHPTAEKQSRHCGLERSRVASCIDDSFLDERAKRKARANSEKAKAQTAKSFRSRPIPCFDPDDLLASIPDPQQKAKGRNPRACRFRPAASSPSFATPLSNTKERMSSYPLALDETPCLAQRNPSAPLPAKPARANLSTKLIGATAKPATPYQSRQYFPSENHFALHRLRASSDGGPMQPPTQDDQPSRMRASSDSTSAPKTQIKTSRLRHYEGKFQNRRGQSLLYFSLFPPEKLAMRGVILHLHGMGDHCRRNVALYERYCQEGFGVIAYDLLNHGASDYDKHRIRAHISNFTELVDDTNDFVTFAKTNIYKVALRYWRKHHHPFHPHGKEKKRESLPELPLIITGNSLGSLIGLHTVLSGKQKFHAAVWASPSIGVMWTPVLRAQWKFAKALLAAFPTAKMIPAVQHSLRSRNPHFLVKYQKDPLTCSDMITSRTGYQIIHAINRLQQDTRISDAGTPFCAIPMLFLAGTNDRISDQQASLNFFSRMESFDKEFKFFEGLYHMIYDEPEQEDVFKYLINWLHKRFPLETRQPDNSHTNLTEKLELSHRQYHFVNADCTEL